MQPARKPDHFGGIFTLNEADRKTLDKEDDKKIKAILARLQSYGIENIVESNVEYALRSQSSKGDSEAAYRLLMLLEETYEGIVRPYNADTKLLGAENRESVTCYLDALLFAMFARLDSFEAMLYESFEDLPRRKLAGMLRLWVNMLRTGRLITTDITSYLQSALAECGWEEASMLKQQDPSEAFTFITGQLELPLLTLKMDLYHTGKEDTDDHKFVNERLLEVALPDQPPEGRSVLTLEDCLEHYFNNRIEVKRHLEAQRRSTLQGTRIEELKNDLTSYMPDYKKESGMHVEVAEVAETPTASTPVSEAPMPKSPTDKLRPTAGRKRADSIFSQRKIEITGVDPETLDRKTTNDSLDLKGRKMSTRTEVLMPAWQFFKLLPWYTDHMPESDAQVAAHFSRKRPVLGIALKRYSYTNDGQARRLDTYVDIPLEITVPNFVSGDDMQEDGPLGGNFRLLLQSVVCHRGVSVNSGHYICLSRGRAANAQDQTPQMTRRDSDSSAEESQDPWMRFDDLAKERVSYVDIHEALKQETPYLLFYQVQPIGDDGHSIHELPSYAEATSRSHSDVTPLEKIGDFGSGSELAIVESNSEGATVDSQPATEATDFGVSPSERTSLDAGTALNSESHNHSASSPAPRRRSIAWDASSLKGSASFSGSGSVTTSNSVPATPSEEKGNAFLSVAKNIGSRRTSRGLSKTSSISRSRPPSAGPDNKEKSNSNRFSLNMSKLTARMSRAEMRDSSATIVANPSSVPVIQPSDAVAAELANETDAKSAEGSPTKDGSANASRESVPATLTPAKRDKKEAKKKGTLHHHHGKSAEERDCVVM